MYTYLILAVFSQHILHISDKNWLFMKAENKSERLAAQLDDSFSLRSAQEMHGFSFDLNDLITSNNSTKKGSSTK